MSGRDRSDLAVASNLESDCTAVLRPRGSRRCAGVSVERLRTARSRSVSISSCISNAVAICSVVELPEQQGELSHDRQEAPRDRQEIGEAVALVDPRRAMIARADRGQRRRALDHLAQRPLGRTQHRLDRISYLAQRAPGPPLALIGRVALAKPHHDIWIVVRYGIAVVGPPAPARFRVMTSPASGAATRDLAGDPRVGNERSITLGASHRSPNTQTAAKPRSACRRSNRW